MTEKKKPERIGVRVLKVKGGSALVEFVKDGVQRVFVPESSVKDGTVSETTLKRGVRYGVPWEEVRLGATAEEVALRLRNAGIWTREDLLRNQQAAIGALQAAYQVDLAALNKLAAKEG